MVKKFLNSLVKVLAISTFIIITCKNPNTLGAVTEPSDFPSKYISENATAVKNQLSFGTCWLISSLDTAQISTLNNNNIEKSGDFSPFQILYFICHPESDKGSSTGDIYPLLNPGGSASAVTYAMACWIGPVAEESLPKKLRYTNIEKLTSEQINGLSINDKYRQNKDAAHLEQVLTTRMSNKNDIKNLIMQHGSVTTSYGDKFNYIILNKKECTYNDVTKDTNHAITIIGWDDNFPKENFSVQPPTDGAWLAKNSWGTENNSPYVWISYNCSSLNKNEATTYAFSNSKEYKYNYQYDAPSFASAYAVSPTSSGAMANIFTAKTDVVLKSVGFFISNTDTEYEAAVYTSLKDANIPTSGNKISSITGVKKYEGYYTPKLNTPVVLKKGEKFAVVINMKTADTIHPQVKFEVEPTYTENSGMCISLTSNPGESFTSYDGINWTDRGTNGNLRIKAFLDDYTTKGSIDSYACTLNKTSIEAGYPINKQDITAIIKYKNGFCRDISAKVSIKTKSFKNLGVQNVPIVYMGKVIYKSKITVIPQKLKNITASKKNNSLQIRWSSANSLCNINIYGLKSINGKKTLLCSVNSNKKEGSLKWTRCKSYKYLFVCQATKKRYNSKTLVSSGTIIEIPH